MLIIAVYDSNGCHPFGQTSLEGLSRDVLQTLGPISYPYVQSSTLHGPHCLSQDFTWLATFTLEHQLAKPGNGTVHE